jgi:hypothetical protein
MLFLTVAAVATKFDFELFQTDDRDVDIERDWSIPQGRPGKLPTRCKSTRLWLGLRVLILDSDSKGVQALVVRKIDA